MHMMMVTSVTVACPLVTDWLPGQL